jgi:transposase-like protein
VTCHNCRTECQPFGKHRNGLRRFRCRQCFKTFTEPHETPLDGMYLPIEKAETVFALLLEGSSVSIVARVYNFRRVHKSLRVTPAMASGIADHIWSVRELLEA